MTVVWLTALGVGGATILGAVLGFIFKNISHRFSDRVLAFAAGVMLAAAVVSLVLPSLEYPGGNLPVTVLGIFCGALALTGLDKLVPHLHRVSGVDSEEHDNGKLDKVLLFVMAIAIHNLPEGIAAGVGAGSGDTGAALTIAVGIALQNIPEGMVIIGPMLASGMKPGRTFAIAMLTGAVEVLGTLLGFFAVQFSAAILPFAMAFAGGTMLYVISDEMIPETHHGDARGVTWFLLMGFCLMLAMGHYLG